MAARFGAIAGVAGMIVTLPLLAATLGPDGYGPIRIGMTQPQVEARLGRKFPASTDPDDKFCREITSDPQRGIFFMFENDRLTRILLTRREMSATTSGIRVGDTEAALRRRYGNALIIKPAAYYDPPAHDITVHKGRLGRGLKFVTTPRRVIRQIIAGGPSIAYIEGCE
jgi:hypothetical protein